MKKKCAAISVFGSVVFTGMGAVEPVNAQAIQSPAPPGSSNAAQSSSLQEVVVTAQRHTEKLQNVGIAVITASGAALKTRGVTSTTDIVRFMPGINIVGTNGNSGQQFSIRGVTENAYSEAVEPPIAVYVDDVYVATQQGQGMALYDVARVEALKGPQGTLFGRNATGGLIQFVVNKPSLAAAPSGYLDATYGSFNQTVLEGAVNEPIGDKFAIRASGFWNRHDAIWKNVYPQGMAAGAPLTFGAPGPTPAGQDLGGEDTAAGRLQMLWAPTNSLEMRLTGSILRQTTSTSPWTEQPVVPELNAQGRVIGEIYASPTETRAAIGPNGQNFYNPKVLPFEGFLFSPNSNGLRAPGADWSGYTPVSAQDLKISEGFARADLNTFNAYNSALHIDDDLGGGVRFASVTAWSLYEKNFVLGDGAPVTRVGYASRSTTSTESEEARLSGDMPSLSWTAGAYYLHLNSQNAQGLFPPSGSALASVFHMAATGVQPLSVYTLKTDSGSLFGQVGWDFLPNLKLIVGGRGVYERQHYDYASYAFASPDNYVIDTNTALFPLLPGYENSQTELLGAGKVQLEYRPWAGLLIYGGVNRGVKAGGYNGQVFTGDAPIPRSQIPFKPEALTSLEGGFKWAEPGSRYTLDAAVFHYIYQGYQSFVFTNVSGIVQNNNAETTGAELDANVEIIHNLTLKLTGAYVDAIVKRLEVAPGVFVNTRPTYTPKYSGSAALAYHVPQDVLGGSLSVDASVFSESSFYSSAKNFAGELFGGYTLVDLDANWALRSGFSISAYIKNVADERYKTAGLDFGTVCGCNLVGYGMPRTFGVTLHQSF